MEKPKNLYIGPHGHELSRGMLKGGEGGNAKEGNAEGRGRKGRKKWDSCSSIINKIY